MTVVTRRASYRTFCTGCADTLADDYYPFCPQCGAMSDVSYDLERVQLQDSTNPYYRYIDLLPVTDPRLLPAAATMTPTVEATRLGTRLGLSRLYLKNETVLPTRTTKDRMAAVALPYLYEAGVRSFTTSSTGNSSTAYAHAISHLPDLRMYVVTAAEFRIRVALEADHTQVVDVVARDASFVDAFDVASRLAAKLGVTAESGFFNPGRREGLKVAWLEVAEQVPRPVDWYVQAVSSAMGVYGVDKAAKELHALGLAGTPPRLLCVQQESCAPMVSAWDAGRDHIEASDIVARPTGLATAILRGDPSRTYPHVRRIVTESGGAMLAVDAADIERAREWTAADAGIEVCHAAAAAIAGLAEAVNRGVVSADDTVVVNLTCADRPLATTTGATHWVERDADGWDLSPIA
jgi:threonine synthase